MAQIIKINNNDLDWETCSSIEEEKCFSPTIKIVNEQELKQMFKVNLDNGEEEKIEDEEATFRACRKTHSCGHKCCGVAGESKCLPCLSTECNQEGLKNANENELCNICYTSTLGEEPSVALHCGHVFHANCIQQLLEHKWNTARINFCFMDCPSCRQEIKIDSYIPVLSEKLQEM